VNHSRSGGSPLEHYDRLRGALASSHLPSLDGLRGIAVSLVILYHLGLPTPGGLGVLIFFVLSGFLITWLLLKEARKSGSVSLAKFYTRRFLRIFPAFYVFAAIGITGLLVFKKHIVWLQVVAALTYWNNYYQAIAGDPNTLFSHTWSLGIEEQFYLLWPGIFVLLSRRPNALIKFLVGVIALVWVHRWFLLFVVRVNRGYIYEAFDTRADSLAAGCLLAVLLWQGKLPRFFNWICARRWLCLPGILLLVVSAALELRYGRWYRDSIGMGLDSILVAICLPQLISFCQSAPMSSMNLPWMRRLGVLSYSMYLYQQALVSPAKKITAGLPVAVELLVAFGLVVLFAEGSYRFVEWPCLQLKKRFEPEAAVSPPKPAIEPVVVSPPAASRKASPAVSVSAR
jgi:peptidoglycan/LPS O-acetylase OafA/YrhL